MSQSNIQTIDSANAQVKELVNGHLGSTPTLDIYNNNLRRTETEIVSSLASLRTDPIGQLTRFIEASEEQTDLQIGIVRTKQGNAVAFVGADKESQKSSVIIRDARLQKELGNEIASRPNDVTESWMINAAATTRGIIKLLRLEPFAEKDADLQTTAVLGKFQDCIKNIQAARTPEERTKITESFNHDIKVLLQSSKAVVAGQRISALTDKEFNKILGDARDFTNFDSDHPATVTITGNLVEGKKINHIESFIPVVSLSGDLKERYSKGKRQSWIDELSPINKALVNAYRDKITDNKHIIPTQLQFLPGVRNYGVSSTLFAENGKILDDPQYTSTRSAAPAYNIGKKVKTDPNLMQEITNENVDHVNAIAQDSGRKLHMHTITNEIMGEQKIGDAVRASAKKSEIDVTKTPLSITLSNKDKNLSTIWDSVKKGARHCTYFACKSGKDRTGLYDKHNQLSAIKEFLSEKYSASKEELQQAYNILNSAWHNENLAGSNGGSLGSYGLKANTSYLLLSTTNLLHSIKDFTLGNKVASLNMPKAKLSKQEVIDKAAAAFDDTARLLEPAKPEPRFRKLMTPLRNILPGRSANRDL